MLIGRPIWSSWLDCDHSGQGLCHSCIGGAQEVFCKFFSDWILQINTRHAHYIKLETSLLKKFILCFCTGMSSVVCQSCNQEQHGAGLDSVGATLRCRSSRQMWPVYRGKFYTLGKTTQFKGDDYYECLVFIAPSVLWCVPSVSLVGILRKCASDFSVLFREAG